jgi:hypothetical protein
MSRPILSLIQRYNIFLTYASNAHKKGHKKEASPEGKASD